MHLADILQKLSYGPLSELSIGGTGSGSVPADEVPKLVHHIGQALIPLHTRFPLRIRQLELETVDGLFEYALRPQYAQSSGSTEVHKYIKDSALDPFTGDVLRIVAVSNAADGCELPLNKRGDERSWFTTGFDQLRMGYPRTGDTYRIEYRARHAALPANPADPTEVPIHLPEELVPALLAHVAAGVYGAMSMEGALAKSQGHMAAFENLCQQHEAFNTWDQHHAPQNTRFESGGWI